MVAQSDSGPLPERPFTVGGELAAHPADDAVESVDEGDEFLACLKVGGGAAADEIGVGQVQCGGLGRADDLGGGGVELGSQALDDAVRSAVAEHVGELPFEDEGAAAGEVAAGFEVAGLPGRGGHGFVEFLAGESGCGGFGQRFADVVAVPNGVGVDEPLGFNELGQFGGHGAAEVGDAVDEGFAVHRDGDGGAAVAVAAEIRECAHDRVPCWSRKALRWMSAGVAGAGGRGCRGGSQPAG